MTGLLDHIGGMQQGFRGNAPHVEADATQVGIAFDEHGIQPQIGATERGGIAARAGANHHHRAFDIGFAAGGGGGLRSGRCLRSSRY